MPQPKPIQPTPPDTPPIDQLIKASATDLKDNTDFECVVISNQASTPTHAHDISLYQSTIQAQSLTASILPNARFTDCTFDRADLSNATWTDARLIRVHITSSKLTGFDARGADLRDVTFTNCKLPDAFFQDAAFTRVRFDNCQIPNLDLTASTIKSLAINHCDARMLRLLDTKIDHLDLRDSLIEAIALNPTQLKSITINPPQAPALAQALGVKVIGQ